MNAPMPPIHPQNLEDAISHLETTLRQAMAHAGAGAYANAGYDKHRFEVSFLPSEGSGTPSPHSASLRRNIRDAFEALAELCLAAAPRPGHFVRPQIIEVFAHGVILHIAGVPLSTRPQSIPKIAADLRMRLILLDHACLSGATGQHRVFLDEHLVDIEGVDPADAAIRALVLSRDVSQAGTCPVRLPAHIAVSPMPHGYDMHSEIRHRLATGASSMTQAAE